MENYEFSTQEIFKAIDEIESGDFKFYGIPVSDIKRFCLFARAWAVILERIDRGYYSDFSQISPGIWNNTTYREYQKIKESYKPAKK